MSETVRRVAIFDLDGTLTWRDTFVDFLVGYVRRRPGRAWRVWRLPLVLAGFLAGGMDRGLLKQRLIQIFMRGDERTAIDSWAQVFAEQTLRIGCRDEGLTLLREHQRAGDFVVLLSASPDLYVPRIGALLGVNRTICTEIAFEGDRLSGVLRTPNRRGEEKRRCLAALKREFPDATFSAYGNSSSDLPHLIDTEHPLLVNGNASARRQAQRLNMAIADWR
jgi:phosphatidylglycerophosphatase C